MAKKTKLKENPLMIEEANVKNKNINRKSINDCSSVCYNYNFYKLWF